MVERTTKDSSFPHWVALGSLVFVLALFFSNTVPALRERQGLADVQAKYAALQQKFVNAIEHTARQTNPGGQDPEGNFDLQSLLVAIDEHDLTPLELWQQYDKQQSDKLQDK